MSRIAFAQIVLVLFAISNGIISTTASHGDHFHVIIHGIERSAICLVQMIAQRNKINVVYNLTDEHRINDTSYFIFTYDIHLGNETYNASATSKKKSKEKVAATAFNQTSFTHPANITDRTCKIPLHPRTDLSVLHEYATLLSTRLAISERQVAVIPPKFEITIGLNGKSASATGLKKSTTKQTAATQLMEALNRERVINDLVRRYNTTKYQGMNSVDRLEKIILTSSEDPAEYIVTEEPNTQNGNRYKVHVLAHKGAETFGFGKTLDEAKEDGAKNILKIFDFIVL